MTHVFMKGVQVTKKQTAIDKDEEDKLIKDYCAELGIPDFRTGKFLNAFGEFLEMVLVPRAIALRRRKAGDPSARASDFCPACGIGEDLRNLCCARRENCPHAAGTDVDANLKNINEAWNRRQALCREVYGEYWKSRLDADTEPLKEFARFYARLRH